MIDPRNTYEIKIERGNMTYHFRLWTEEALDGDWCLALDIPIPGEGETQYEHIHPSWPDGSARYFPADYVAFTHIDAMIQEQERLHREALEEK